MNIEELREYCISLEAVEEKFPFAKIMGGENVLVFYVCNHMFAMVDLNDSDVVNIKCQPERILDLREHYEWADKASHMNSKYWLGMHLNGVMDDTAKELISNSYSIVKKKYTKKKRQNPLPGLHFGFMSFYNWLAISLTLFI